MRLYFEKDLRGLISEKDYGELLETLEALDEWAKEFLENKDFIRRMRSLSRLRAGDFVNAGMRQLQIANDSHRKSWGERFSLYSKIMLGNLQERLAPTAKREKTLEVAKCYGFDAGDPELRKALMEIGVYHSAWDLERICSSSKETKELSLEDMEMRLLLYRDHLFRTEEVSEDKISLKISMRKDWVIPIEVKIPKRIKQKQLEDIQSLFIRRSKDGSLKILFSCEVPNKPPASTVLAGCWMGVDLGIVKPFSAAVSWGDGSYSEELTPSKELSRMNDKLGRLKEEATRISAKYEKLVSLFGGESGSATNAKNKKDETRRKIARLKDHMARVVARDIVNHALANNAEKINLEDLRFVSRYKTSWNYGKMRRCIEELAYEKGVEVSVVSARNTSRTDPFGDSMVKPGADRRSKMESGLVIDRDYAAALEISRRFRGGKRPPLVEALRKTKKAQSGFAFSKQVV